MAYVFLLQVKLLTYFSDNIFTDIAVNNQINKSYNDICSLQRNVENGI